MAYAKQQWLDGSTAAPYGPLSAARLGTIETALFELKQGAIDPMASQYGAKGDGSTDDVAAITAAIADCASGQSLLFRSGASFALASSLTVTKPLNVIAYGATFKPTSAASGRIQIGTSTTPVSGLVWRGGSYDGTGGSNFVWAMNCFFGTGCRLEDFTFSNMPANVNADGVVISGDGRLVSDAATTAGSTSVTSASGAFTSADVGKTVIIWTAGTGGCAFESRITSVTSATVIVLAHPVWLSVTGARMNIATMQNVVVKNIRGTAAGGDSFRCNASACGVDLEDSFFQNSCTSGGTKGGVMSNGAPFVVVKNVGIDGVNGFGIRLMGYKNKAIAPRVRNWPSTNDAIRMCEEGIEVIAPEVQDSKDGGGSGYGIRLSNDSGLSTAPIGMRVTGGNVRGCGGVKIDFVGPNGAAPIRCTIDTTVEGCSQDGVLVGAGSHHSIRGIFANNARDGVHADNITDCTVDAICHGNTGYGVRTTGTSDRWKISGSSRAADNTTGATSLTNAGNNVAALIT